MLVVAGDDFGCLRLFNYPCDKEGKAVCKTYTGHSASVTNARFTLNDEYVLCSALLGWAFGRSGGRWTGGFCVWLAVCLLCCAAEISHRGVWYVKAPRVTVTIISHHLHHHHHNNNGNDDDDDDGGGATAANDDDISVLRRCRGSCPTNNWTSPRTCDSDTPALCDSEW